MNRRQYEQLALQAAITGRVAMRELLSPKRAAHIVLVKHSLYYAASMLGEYAQTMAAWSGVSHSTVRLALKEADQDRSRVPLAVPLHEWGLAQGFGKVCGTRLQNRANREEPSAEYPDECPHCGYHFAGIHELSAHLKRNGR